MPTELGQNFLTNKNIAQKIVDAADLTCDDFVLEIGPGKGVLTEELAKKVGKVVAVEIDKALSNLLSNKFSNRKNIEIVNGDILRVNLEKIAPHPAFQATLSQRERRKGERSYKVVANLPYYITSPIIRMFLEAEPPPKEMILMVQKEVAERIAAGPGKMSILSVAVQYYAKPEILFFVGKENFKPVPEVESAVIRIKTLKHKNTRAKEQNKKFFQIVRAGFCAKRKMLANNLTNSFHLDKKKVEEKIISAGLDKNVRAQELSINDWKILVKLF